MRTLQQIHREVIDIMTPKQYFKWHNSQEQIQLDYKWKFETVKASTTSKKLIALCNEGIQVYNETITK